MASARSALSTVFGFADFRPGQEDVLAATFAGEDVLITVALAGLFCMSLSKGGRIGADDRPAR